MVLVEDTTIIWVREHKFQTTK